MAPSILTSAWDEHIEEEADDSDWQRHVRDGRPGVGVGAASRLRLVFLVVSVLSGRVLQEITADCVNLGETATLSYSRVQCLPKRRAEGSVCYV